VFRKILVSDVDEILGTHRVHRDPLTFLHCARRTLRSRDTPTVEPV
jgi:hypothetical protein